MGVSSPVHVCKAAFFSYLIFQASSLRKCTLSSHETGSDTCFPSSLGTNMNFRQFYSDQKGWFYLKNIRIYFLFIFICDCFVSTLKKGKKTEMSTFSPHTSASSPQNLLHILLSHNFLLLPTQDPSQSLISDTLQQLHVEGAGL